MEKAPKTFTDAIQKLLTVRYNTKVAIHRNYDNWFFKQLLEDKKRQRLIGVQSLDYVYHQRYGSDLAVSKFVIGYCGGVVRDQDGKWIDKERDLPKEFLKSFKVTHINAAKASLLTEGIDNFVGLHHLESIDLSNNPRLDDFACDQLGRQFRMSKTLKAINLSFNPRISIYGLEALFKIPSIRRIVAVETQASQHEEIEIFRLCAEDEANCEVITDNNLKQLPGSSPPKLEARETASTNST